MDGQLMDHREGETIAVMPLDEIKMSGRCNQANALAAATTALSAGADHESVRKVLQEFPGLPHRLEWVRKLDGADWYNDSKGTNVGAVVESLKSFESGAILIAGGKDKKGDFSTLVPYLEKHADGVILIGEAAEAMEQAWSGMVPLVQAESLEIAVAEARSLVKPGEAVLLSPACASFDMFKSFGDRGDQFKAAVNALEEEA